MKIAVYTIAKNEETNVEPWFQSAKDADYITFCDNYSTDETAIIARNAAIRHSAARMAVIAVGIDPWRFDWAHNAALALVPLDADICIPLHLDERLTPGWRERIEWAWNHAGWVKKYSEQARPTQLFYPYKWSEDLTFLQNRIHARKGLIWRYADHEGIFHYFDTQPNQVTVQGQEPLIVQEQKPRPLNPMILKRLQWALEEFPGDTRVMYYLARELTYHGRYADALPILLEYFKVDTDFAFEQRDAAALLYKCYKVKAHDPFDKRSSLSEPIARV